MEVPASLDGERVDRAVALLSGWSRGEVRELIEAGLVLVDGAVVAPSRRLTAGAAIELLGEPSSPDLPLPEHLPIEVRYEDADVLVIAKPAGLVVHPGAGHTTGTLVNGLLARYPEIAGVGDPARPGVVHRLDRDTSGLLLVARSERGYESLVDQLSSRRVDRRYDALCWGTPASSRGVIDAPIGRSATRRTRMAVREQGREARTRYEVIRSWQRPEVALLECVLETGRTHQIRVHLAAIGHPIVSDATYGGYRESIRLARPFLHARLVGFARPDDGEWLCFEEPLPFDLASVLDELAAPA